MATSLLADSLAVACQTILARSTAAGELKYARKVGSERWCLHYPFLFIRRLQAACSPMCLWLAGPSWHGQQQDSSSTPARWVRSAAAAMHLQVTKCRKSCGMLLGVAATAIVLSLCLRLLPSLFTHHDEPASCAAQHIKCCLLLLVLLQVAATAIMLALSLGVLLSLILGGTMHLLPSIFTQGLSDACSYAQPLVQLVCCLCCRWLQQPSR
jgi:hypothetical protein